MYMTWVSLYKSGTVHQRMLKPVPIIRHRTEDEQFVFGFRVRCPVPRWRPFWIITHRITMFSILTTTRAKPLVKVKGQLHPMAQPVGRIPQCAWWPILSRGIFYVNWPKLAWPLVKVKSQAHSIALNVDRILLFFTCWHFSWFLCILPVLIPIHVLG